MSVVRENVLTFPRHRPTWVHQPLVLVTSLTFYEPLSSEIETPSFRRLPQKHNISKTKNVFLQTTVLVAPKANNNLW